MSRPGRAVRAARAPAGAGAALALALGLAGCGPAPRGVPLGIATWSARPVTSPLALPPDGGSFFVDSASGRAVFLTGSHTWNNFQDWGITNPPRRFDDAGYLDFLARHGHDFIRLYTWEQAAWFPGTADTVFVTPLPYARTGPGRALDGGTRFDLARFDTAYFGRLRARVEAARERGIYVSVMLFDGWSVEDKGQATGNPWRGHPFNRANNVNGVDGDPNGDGEGRETHTLAVPAVTALQRRYLARVVGTLADLDNVLWEISNESDPGAIAWEYEMIRTLRALDSARGRRHPIGLTATYPPDGRGNAPLFDSPADWISPREGPGAPYEYDPPAARPHGKIVITDTDHLWGVGGRPAWVWKSFLRGLNPIFMDPYVTAIRHNLPAWPPPAGDPRARDGAVAPEWEGVRTAMGLARAVAGRVDLGALRPMGELASSRYCLAAPGREYLVYLPWRGGRVHRLAERLLGRLAAGQVNVDLSATHGSLGVEWVDVRRGLLYPDRPVVGGRRAGFRAPFPGDAVLHVWSAGANARAGGAPPGGRAERRETAIVEGERAGE